MLLGANCHTSHAIALLPVDREVSNGTRME